MLCLKVHLITAGFFGCKRRVCLNVLRTWSWALLFAFPDVNSTVPLMSAEVCRSVSLWTVPIFSMRTRELGCRASPFRLQMGDFRTGTETSHSKHASSGATTSTSSSSLSIIKDWAGQRHERRGGTSAIQVIQSIKMCCIITDLQHIANIKCYKKAQTTD